MLDENNSLPLSEYFALSTSPSMLEIHLILLSIKSDRHSIQNPLCSSPLTYQTRTKKHEIKPFPCLHTTKSVAPPVTLTAA